MALDNAQWIAELSVADPLPDDPVGQGDDHIRTCKTVLDNTFLGDVGASDVWDSVNGALLVGPTELNSYPARIATIEDMLVGGTNIPGPLHVDGSVIVFEGQFAVGGTNSIPLSLAGTSDVIRGRIDNQGSGGINVNGWQLYSQGAFKGNFGWDEVTNITSLSGPNGSLTAIEMNSAAEVKIPNDFIVGLLGVSFNSIFVSNDDTLQMSINGGDAGGQGGQVLLFGQNHASKAADIEFRANNVIKMNWDDSIDTWRVRAGMIVETGGGRFTGTQPALPDGSGEAQVFGNTTNGGALRGRGNTNDVVIMNQSGFNVLEIPTGTRDITMPAGDLQLNSGDIRVFTGGGSGANPNAVARDISINSNTGAGLTILSGTGSVAQIRLGDGTDTGKVRFQSLADGSLSILITTAAALTIDSSRNVEIPNGDLDLTVGDVDLSAGGYRLAGGTVLAFTGVALRVGAGSLHTGNTEIYSNAATLGLVIRSTGTDISNGDLKVVSLAGTGSRTVVAAADGTLSAP